MQHNHLDIVLCWHMHQPEYRNLQTGEYLLPWTYLHAIKDYADMVTLLEQNPKAKATVNFTPILLEQINDYVDNISHYIQKKQHIKDPLLAMLISDNMPRDVESQIKLIESCIKVNESRILKRYPTYKKLVSIAKAIIRDPVNLAYVNHQYFSDLITWFHIAWLGESITQSDENIKQLIQKEEIYTGDDRQTIFNVIYQQLKNLLPRYAALAKKQQIELCTTPYAHPITPLLHDIHAANDASPDLVLPINQNYPDGDNRAAWHLQKAVDVFKQCFNHTPKGIWPSEGGLDQFTLSLLKKYNITWTASGENVLRNSLMRSHSSAIHHGNPAHIMYKDSDTNIHVAFRDDGISDAIGFQYSNLSTDNAINDLIGNLEHIASSSYVGENNVVSIIMDGENAWEYFIDNGFPFLDQLYKKLVDHPTLNLTTFSECIKTKTSSHLPELVSGSWVYGTFSTWIGDKDKNLGWDLLHDAKCAFDEVIANHGLTEYEIERAEHQLAICEGSDWFWWFGDENPAEAVSLFDQAYRMHLRNLYHLIKLPAPDKLSHPISQGSHINQSVCTMKPGHENQQQYH